MSGTVSISIDGRVATLAIDRPPLNIFDLATLAELDDALGRLAERDDLQVVVVRGRERAFSAGVAVEDHVGDRVPRMLESFHSALRRLYRLEATTVAVVRGHCLGGGMELAAVCDLVVAADDARFGQPEIALGCYPPLAAALYPLLFGERRTLDLLLTGRGVDAEEARRLGFVNRLATVPRLDDAADALVAELTAHSAAVQRLAKRAVRHAVGDRFERALAASERLYVDELLATSDMDEGIGAFLEKRSPTWQHG